jgi:hypothetical protein
VKLALLVIAGILAKLVAGKGSHEQKAYNEA